MRQSHCLCIFCRASQDSMGFKCAAYGCKSGYASSAKNVRGVTFHAFPADPELRDKWIRANPRKDFIPTIFSRICSLHFQEFDFMEARRDSNKNRLKTKSEKPVRKLLKKGAVPSKFSNVPSYLHSKSVSTPCEVYFNLKGYLFEISAYYQKECLIENSKSRILYYQNTA